MSQMKKILGDTFFFYSTVLIIICTSLSVIAGFRMFGIDPDYNNYQIYYESITKDISLNSSRFEYGFFIFTWFIKNILRFDFNFFLIAVAFISLGLKFYLFSRNRYILFIIFLYVLLLYPLHEMVQIRLSLAIGFGSLAIYFSSTNRLLTIICAIFSLFLHYSLILFVAIALIPNNLIDIIQKSKLLVVCVTVVIAFLGASFWEIFAHFNPMLELYVQNSDLDPVNVFSTQTAALLILLCLGWRNLSEMNLFHLRAYLISLIGMLFFIIFFSIPVFSQRAFQLSFISYLFWIPTMRGFYKDISFLTITIFAIYLFVRNIFLYPLFI